MIKSKRTHSSELVNSLRTNKMSRDMEKSGRQSVPLYTEFEETAEMIEYEIPSDPGSFNN